jgi:hypothetical protein
MDLNIKASGMKKLERETVWEFKYGQMVLSMKVIGSMIKQTA